MINEIIHILTKRSDLDWFLVNNCDEVIIFSKTNDSLKMFHILEIGALIERELND